MCVGGVGGIYHSARLDQSRGCSIDSLGRGLGMVVAELRTLVVGLLPTWFAQDHFSRSALEVMSLKRPSQRIVPGEC